MLKRHGSARVEDVLWQRYRQLHEKWKYRLNEFKPTNKLSNNHDKHENQLFGALVEGYGWHIDIQKLKELKKLSMKDSVRKRADRIMDDLSKPPSIGIWMNNEKIFFRVGYCNEFVLEDIKKN